MSFYSNANFSLNNTLSNRREQVQHVTNETASTAQYIPGRRRSRSTGLFSSNSSKLLPSTSSSPPSSFPKSSSVPQARGLPNTPIDSEVFPDILNEDENDMYKIPGKNVYVVPFGSAPSGAHPGWPGYTAAPVQATYQPYPATNYYPGQPRQYYEDAHSTSRDRQKFVVPSSSGYETDTYEDGQVDPRAYQSDGDRRRPRRFSRASAPATLPKSMEYKSQFDPRSAYRPPQSVSPSNSSATDDSGRSSANSYGSGSRSVRWHDNLVAPTPPPSAPRPKGWFNRRGDQLWCNDGRYKAAVEEYPHYLRDYPDVGEGWMNEHGVRISMTHRRIPELCAPPPKGVLKNSGNPLRI